MFVGQSPGIPQRRYEGQRQNHRPRPCRDVVEIEVKPLGQEDDFRRNARAGVVADLAEGREIEFGEAVALFRAAEPQHDFAGASHVRGVGIVAHELQGEIRLDGPRKIGRPAGKQAPSAFGVLQIPQIIGDLWQVGIGFLFEDEFEQDVFGFEDAVALKFADPKSGGILQTKQRVSGFLPGELKPVRRFRREFPHHRESGNCGRSFHK